MDKYFYIGEYVMNEFLDTLNKDKMIEIQNDISVISYPDNIQEETLLKELEKIFNYQCTLKTVNLTVNIKNQPKTSKISAFKMALNRLDIKDPLFILNIMNMARIYRVLGDEMFEQNDVFFNSSQELLDIKLACKNELNIFRKELSKYFIATLQSFPKVKFTPTDIAEELPNIFKIIFKTTDLLTLCGILRVSPEFSTADCPTIFNAFEYVASFVSTTSIGMELMNEFLEEKGYGNTEGKSNSL